MRVLLLSGPLAVGKTSVTEALAASHDFKRIRTGAYLADLARQRGIAVNRTSLQEIGDGLDAGTGYRWVLDQVAAPLLAGARGSDRWLLDSARKTQQVTHFRDHSAIQHPNEIASRELIAIADAVVDVAPLTSVDAALEVARRCQEFGGLQCARSC